MADIYAEEKVEPVTPMKSRDLMAVIFIGALVGLVLWIVYWFLSSFLTPRLFCNDTMVSSCATARAVSDGIGLTIGAIIALLGLIRLRIFRPLLVVLAVLLCLGGLAQKVDGLSWYWSAAVCVGLFAGSYALYTWVARIKAFWLAVLVTVVLAVATRLILFS